MCAKRDGTRGKVEAVDNVVVEAAANSDEVQVDVAEGRPNGNPPQSSNDFFASF